MEKNSISEQVTKDVIEAGKQHSWELWPGYYKWILITLPGQIAMLTNQVNWKTQAGTFYSPEEINWQFSIRYKFNMNKQTFTIKDDDLEINDNEDWGDYLLRILNYFKWDLNWAYLLFETNDGQYEWAIEVSPEVLITINPFKATWIESHADKITRYSKEENGQLTKTYITGWKEYIRGLRNEISM